MKLYFAGPLFTTPERTWNAEVVAALRAAGHEIFLPQEKEPGKDAAGIFATDVGGIDLADGLVAIMDGADPDSGTCWEVGYAYGSKKPIVLVRTDFRDLAGQGRTVQPAHGRVGDDPSGPACGLHERGHHRDPRGAVDDRTGSADAKGILMGAVNTACTTIKFDPASRSS
jgi:Nucleoside 2-deoxyribosyltransferase